MRRTNKGAVIVHLSISDSVKNNPGPKGPGASMSGRGFEPLPSPHDAGQYLASISKNAYIGLIGPKLLVR